MNLEPKDYVDKDASGHSCDVSLMSLDVPPPKGPLFVFGIPFLQKYFTVYDEAAKKVGFAVARHSGRESAVLVDLRKPRGHSSTPETRPAAFLARSQGQLK